MTLHRLPLCLLAAVFAAACAAPPRASTPVSQPYLLLVHGERDEVGAHSRATSTTRGFARLSLDTGFATLEAWQTLRESHTDERTGKSDEHAHRTAVTWLGGDAMSAEDALVVYFDGSVTRCRDFEPDGSAGGEHACPGLARRFAIVCRPSALIVDDTAPLPGGRALRPASALRCVFDGETPRLFEDMMVGGALWFPLDPSVRLSKLEGARGMALRFETAPAGWTALERPVTEP